MSNETKETFYEGQEVYFVHPVESWIKGLVKEVVQTKNKSGAMETSYTCQGTAEKTLLPTITGPGAIVTKLPPSSLHHVVYTGSASESGSDSKSVTFYPDGRDTFSDLLDLSYLHDSTLLEQVRKRYFANLIYTRIGPIVLALNPYDYNLPNYVDSNMPTYINEGSVIVANAGKSQLLPHAWSTAHYAYWLLSNGEPRINQSVIVSGESGAGKTETAKIVVKYLGKVSTSQCAESVREAATQVTARVNLTSPILEAFGNAKTKKNDNSSRFGKFMKVHFNLPTNGTGGVMVGVSIDVYLLEKSRIITHGDGERAYHCFYQLLSRSTSKPSPEKAAVLKGLQLETAEDYPSLNVGKATEIPGVDDASDWQEVVNAMSAVGLSSNEESSVWKVIGTVLHLLDVKISALNHDECEIEGVDVNAGGAAPTTRSRSRSMAPGRDVPSADRAAKNAKHLAAVKEIIGIDMNAFAAELITTKSVIQGETIVRKLKKAAAVDVRDAICKFLYEALFLWLVAKINGLISPPAEAKDTWIALLDIFGFENFVHNSFEQMCINLANETLQNHYNSVVFTRDMAECHSEGINTTSVTFYDNQPCLDMVCGVNFSMCGVPGQKGGSIVTSKLSITSLLDDESSLGNGSDLSFCSKIDDAFGAKGAKPSHPNFEKPKTQNNAFIIKHYAGDVKYTVDGFRTKNADTTKDALKDLIQTSPNEFMAGLVVHYKQVQEDAVAQTQSSGLGLKSGNTVSAFFKNQLVRLMTEINRTTPHWIRCVKPHSAKKPKMFCGEEVMTQMRSAGVLETVRIRQQSFSIRLPFTEFLSGPAMLLLKKMPHHTTTVLAARAKTLAAEVDTAKVAVDNAVASKATPGKIKEVTAKWEASIQAASALATVVAEMSESGGVRPSGSPADLCKITLRRCGVDSHELAQVGTTKVFMRAPAFQQVHRQVSEIKITLANILIAQLRAREACSKVRCLQMNHYVKEIGSCLQARASSVIMRKKELVITEKDLVTRFRDLLLKEAEEARVREGMVKDSENIYAAIIGKHRKEVESLQAAWLEAMAERHKKDRQRIEGNESAARTCGIMNEESRERAVLFDLCVIFDDETEGRLELEAEEEELRETCLLAEASILEGEISEAKAIAAALALRRCEALYDTARRDTVANYEHLIRAYKLEADVLRSEIAGRTSIAEEEVEVWERDISYEHDRGWARQRALWEEHKLARLTRHVRLLMRHETNARAGIEVEYEQYLITIYNRIDASLEEADEKRAIRIENEEYARRMATKEKKRAEEERYNRWVEEQREVAKAIWVAAKEAEAEVEMRERERQRGFEQRLKEAERVRERIRTQQEREVQSRGKGVKPPVGPTAFVGIARRLPSNSNQTVSSSSPSRSSLQTSARYLDSSPTATSPMATHSAQGEMLSPLPRNGGSPNNAAGQASTANTNFKLLMSQLEAVSSSDLTPRTKRTLRLQLARGTSGLPKTSPQADEVDDDAAFEPQENNLDHSHRAMVAQFDNGVTPLGKYRDYHKPVQHDGSIPPTIYSSPSRGSPRSADGTIAVESPTMTSLARRGITSATAQHKSLTPSLFTKVSTNPFDSTWRPVAAGTKAYLPDGSLVDIA